MALPWYVCNSVKETSFLAFKPSEEKECDDHIK
jgi:hypothetical protein